MLSSTESCWQRKWWLSAATWAVDPTDNETWELGEDIFTLMEWLHSSSTHIHHHILSELHNTPTGGCLGENKMANRLKQQYYWGVNIVKNSVGCTVYGASKTGTLYHRWYKPGAPIQAVAVDILGPFPETPTSNCYILVAMDHFTKWAKANAITNQVACKYTCEWTVPSLHSDQGRQLTIQHWWRKCANVLGSTKLEHNAIIPRAMGS